MNMSKIKITIPSVMNSLTNGQNEIDLEADTIANAIEILSEKYGEKFKQKLLEEDGKPRAVINFYVNGKNIQFLNNLNTVLSDGDEILLLPAVSGG